MSRSMPRGVIPIFSQRRRCSWGARSSGISGPFCKPNCAAMRSARSEAVATPHSANNAASLSGLETAYPEVDPPSAAPRKTSTTSRP